MAAGSDHSHLRDPSAVVVPSSSRGCLLCLGDPPAVVGRAPARGACSSRGRVGGLPAVVGRDPFPGAFSLHGFRLGEGVRSSRVGACSWRGFRLGKGVRSSRVGGMTDDLVRNKLTRRRTLGTSGDASFGVPFTGVSAGASTAEVCCSTASSGALQASASRVIWESAGPPSEVVGASRVRGGGRENESHCS